MSDTTIEITTEEADDLMRLVEKAQSAIDRGWSAQAMIDLHELRGLVEVIGDRG